MRIRAYGRSDHGRVLPRNQDSLVVYCPPDAEVGIFVVADGTGDPSHGHEASRFFTEHVSKHILQARDIFLRYTAASDREQRDYVLQELEKIVDGVSQELYQRIEQRPEWQGISTTGVVLVLVNEGAFIAHAGDSRAYLLRRDAIYQLTEDHTLVNRFLKDGLLDNQKLQHFPFRNVLTRAFGTSPRVDIDTLFVQLEPGDRFVLCTDGLTGYLRNEELEAQGQTFELPQHFVEGLIDHANQCGGEGNITVAVVDVIEADEKRDALKLQKKIEFLRSLFLFQDFTDPELIRALRTIYVVKKKEKELIIEEGTWGNELFVLVEGLVDVMVDGENLTSVGPGGHFGELALIDDHYRSASIIARTDVILLAMTRENFLRLLEDDARLANKILWRFLRNMAGRVRDLSAEVSSLRKRET